MKVSECLEQIAMFCKKSFCLSFLLDQGLFIGPPTHIHNMWLLSAMKST